jgi:hypothetical protein
MSGRLLVCSLLAVLAVGSAGWDSACADEGAPADRDPPLEERVNKAIDSGVAWLKQAQHKNGSWGPCVSSGISYDGTRTPSPLCHVTGPTTFSLFTLARCGVPRKDPVMLKGLAWVQKHVPKQMQSGGTAGVPYTSYESASAILMLCALYDTGEVVKASSKPQAKPKGTSFSTRHWRLLHACVEHLIGRSRRSRGCQVRSGGFGYYGTSAADGSITQFALLALREAVRAGFPLERIRKDVWTSALKYLKGAQQHNGAYAYRSGHPWTDGITAANLASLLICREQMRRTLDAPNSWFEAKIKKAFAHLGATFDPAVNNVEQKPGADLRHQIARYHYCYLYAIERVGSLAKRHLLGGKDWYRLGAWCLVNWQYADGSWLDFRCMGPKDVLGTCFALLFLKRTTRPAVVTGS